MLQPTASYMSTAKLSIACLSFVSLPGSPNASGSPDSSVDCAHNSHQLTVSCVFVTGLERVVHEMA